MKYLIEAKLQDGLNYFCGFTELSPGVMANIWDTDKNEALIFTDALEAAATLKQIGLEGATISKQPETIGEIRQLKSNARNKNPVYLNPSKTFKRLNDKS